MFFTPWTIPILLAFFLSLWASQKVKGTFEKYSQVTASPGLTGAEMARKMLDENGLSHISIECISGDLSDHYDPISKVVRLSERVYHGRTVASLSVACHEIGHAIQDKTRYPMLILRHKMFPAVNFSSGIAPVLLMGGFFFRFAGLILLGIIAFSAAVAFQVVTLPVEFNASTRAKKYLKNTNCFRNDEEKGVHKMLDAAALTYVGAALMSVLQLLEYVWIFNRRN